MRVDGEIEVGLEIVSVGQAHGSHRRVLEGPAQQQRNPSLIRHDRTFELVTGREANSGGLIAHRPGHLLKDGLLGRLAPLRGEFPWARCRKRRWVNRLAGELLPTLKSVAVDPHFAPWVSLTAEGGVEEVTKDFHVFRGGGMFAVAQIQPDLIFVSKKSINFLDRWKGMFKAKRIPFLFRVSRVHKEPARGDHGHQSMLV